MIHISLDIETFSSRGDASIASIGAYAFTISHTHALPVPWEDPYEFERYVEDPAGHFSQKTIRWHAQQVDPVGNLGKAGVPLDSALLSLTHWINALRLTGTDRQNKHDVRVWSHATFDVPIIQLAAAARAGVDNPWPFRDARDLRTLYEIAGGRPEPTDLPVLPPHNALNDAIRQAHEVALCYARLRAKGVVLP